MPVSLDRIVRANVTRATRTASRRAFGVALIAAYHTVFPERVREYTDPSEMLDDGFGELHPAYLAAVALCSQDPRPTSFKVGRRAGAPDQTVRFTPATPTEGEEFSVEIGGVTFTVTADATPTVAELTAALTLLINADPDAIIASGVGSTAGIQNILPASYNGIRGDGPYEPARNLTLTLNAHADWNATTITVTGTDSTGRTITEAFTVPDGGDTVLVGTKTFASVTNINIPAQGGVGGTLLVGLGDLFENPDLDITATDGTTHVDISADDVGAWFAIGASSNVDVEDRTAVPVTTLTADLTAIRAADADWYWLIVADAQSDVQIVQAAAWMEADSVPGIYLGHSFDSDVEDDIDTDVASQLLDASYFRTGLFYSRANAHPEAALIGYLAARPTGSTVGALKTLAGVTADELSTAVVGRLIGQLGAPISSKRVTIYGEILPSGTNVGTPVTLGGLVAGGEWIDVIYGIDFVRARIQERAFNRLLEQDKLPYTKIGIDAFLGAIRSALREASVAPYNILDPNEILVEGTALEDVDPADRQNRFYDGARWDARVQGAIQAAEINGTVRP